MPAYKKALPPWKNPWVPSVRLSRRAALVLCAVVVAVAPIAGWIASTSARGDRAPENLDVAGQAVGGDSRAEVTQAVDALAATYAAVPVTVVAGDVTVTSTAGALGVAVDEPTTVVAVMDHGEDGFAVGRFVQWLWSYVSDSNVEPAVVVDDTVATAEVDRLLAGKTGGPVEPSFELQDGKLVAIAGHPGLGIETADVVAGLHRLRFSTTPLRVDVASHTVQPRYSLKDAQDLVDEANGLTAEPIEVKAGDVTASLDVPTLRSLLVGTVSSDGLAIGLDPTTTSQALATALAAATTPPQDASITDRRTACRPLRPGIPARSAVPRRRPTCSLRRCTRGRTDPVDLPLEEVPPTLSTEQLDALGLKQVVATFTTKHKAGEARVTNIHRMADLVRGTIIRPGEVFSINQLVGERTEAEGLRVRTGDRRGASRGSGRRRRVAVRHDDVQRVVLRRAGLRAVPKPQPLHLPLPVRARGDARVARAGSADPQHHPVRHPDLALVHQDQPDSHPLLDEVLHERRSDEPDDGDERRVHVGHDGAHPVYLDGTKKVDVVRARYRPSEGINCDGSGPGTTTTTTSTVAAETTVAPTTAAPTTLPPETAPTVPTVPTTPTTVLLAPSVPPDQQPAQP